jgi:glyoxylase-like metal-dependent hydrolase (beta-lactamase superfamily II)
MRRIVKWAALLLLLGVAGLVGAVAWTVRSTLPIRQDVALEGVQVVKDGLVSIFILELAPGAVALIDAGSDPEGKAVLAALARRGLGPEAVKAILLTHGDYDHVSGAPRFPAAEVVAMEGDVALAEGRAQRGLLAYHPARPTGLKVARSLTGDGALEVGGLQIRYFAVPGYSAGSAAYLARGILFLGDSAEAMKDGRLDAGWWFTNDSTATEERSLRALAGRLGPLADRIRAIACAHSGVLVGGVAPLAALANRR